MNRRRFLELLGKSAVTGAVVYSFPSVIVPKNIVTPLYWSEELTFRVVDSPEFGFGFTGFKDAIDKGNMFTNFPVGSYDFIPKDEIWMIAKGRNEIWTNIQTGESGVIETEKPKLVGRIVNVNV